MTQAVSPPVFPRLLPEKGTVGIVAPSCSVVGGQQVSSLVQVLERRGYKALVHDQCGLKNGRLAGTDAQRAQAINDMFANPAVDAVMCARGGFGALLSLDLLDYEMIRKNPKPYIGFSDSTAVLQALAARAGLVSFHGPMGWNFLPDRYLAETEEALFAAISEAPKVARRIDLAPAHIERPGSAEGRLVGGNLATLQSLIGTPYDWSGDGAILFIEEIEEPFYRIERMLAQMRLAGKFEGVRAVLVGEMVDLLDEKPDLNPDEHEYYGFTLQEILLKHLPKNVPLAFNVPCGHGKKLMTFPVGAQVQINHQNNTSEMIFNPWP